MIFQLTVVALMFTSCVKPVETVNGHIPPETLSNVSYGSDPKQKMDVYLPANRNTDSTKTIVVVHGGGWNEGDKTDFTPYVIELQRRLPGYAFANINYRLFNISTGINKFPTQENDVMASIDFIKSKSAEYNISKDIVLLGASAGGHLVLLHGYKNSEPGEVKAIVSFFGPSDLVEFYNHPANAGVPLILNALIGATPSQNNALYEQSSPIHFVTAQSPPTLLLQGGKDPLVPENQSVLLKNKLSAVGVHHQYIYYPNEGHGWTGNNLSDSFNQIQSFILKY